MQREIAIIIEKMVKEKGASDIKEVQKNLKEETGILLKEVSPKKKD